MKLLDRLVAIWQAEQPGEDLPDPKKGMERRTFLKILGGSAAVAVAAPYADLEALIWTPDKTILLPEPIVLAPAFAVGDVFEIAGHFAINPITMKATTFPQQYVVTDVFADTFGKNKEPDFSVQFVPRTQSGRSRLSQLDQMRERTLMPHAIKLGS